MARPDEAAHELTIGERGRVVIPAELRRVLGIRPGDRLLAHVEDGSRLVLEDRPAAVARLRGLLAPMPGERSGVDEFLAERRATADLEEAERSGDAAAIRRAQAALERLRDTHDCRPGGRKRAG